jgi:hypothetical protein
MPVTLRRPRLLALLTVVATLIVVGGLLLWSRDLNSQSEDQAIGDLKTGLPQAMPELLKLGGRGDKLATRMLVEIYVQGDHDLGVTANDNAAAHWVKRSDSELELDVYFAKAFLDGTDPEIRHDPRRSAFWLTQAYDYMRKNRR